MTSPSADVIVVGLGAMGSASLYQLARRGARVIGIDRFHPPHVHGSSHGESRITRQAIGEGEEYVPFVLRSHEIWRDLEADTGEALLFQVGGLLMTRESGSARHHGQGDFVGQSIAAARRFGIAHEILGVREIQERFPPFRLVGDEIGYYEPGAGYVRPERCVAAQLDRARAHGPAVTMTWPAVYVSRFVTTSTSRARGTIRSTVSPVRVTAPWERARSSWAAPHRSGRTYPAPGS